MENFTGQISLVVLTVLHINKFATFLSFKRKMTDQNYEKLFKSLEENVRKVPRSAEHISRFISHEEDVKNFKLQEGEKSEIKGIFDILENISIEQFNRAGDDINEFTKEVEKKIREDPSKMDVIRATLLSKDQEIFNKMLNETASTYKRGSQGNEFSDAFKKFCSYLYVKMGRGAYKILELNASIPSISTCVKNIQKKYKGIEVGKIYAKELREFLERNNLEKIVCISEDATRLKPYLKYDSKLQELSGLVLPHSLSGLPNNKDQKIETPEDIMRLVKKFPLANFVEIIIAKSLSKGNYLTIFWKFLT
jgi:hypothetical protein